MENFFTRYRNPTILGAVLLAQVIGLAVQVKRPLDPLHPDAGSVRLLRLWAASVITPLEKLMFAAGNNMRQTWHDYINVIGLRKENATLRELNERLQIEQTRLAEDASQAHRLQALLEFKEKFIAHTIAAQVIGSSGSEQSRVLLIDKGASDGLQTDMAVITPQGIVGKVRDVFPTTAQILVMNDATSGVGAILQKSRLNGVVKGTISGGLILDHLMSDEKVETGELVVTSGGDRIYPKGLPVGTVTQVSPGSDLFWIIKLKPVADLDRLEEVLVITEMQAAQPESTASASSKTADVLAQRLPGLSPKMQSPPSMPNSNPNINPAEPQSSRPHGEAPEAAQPQ